MKISGFTFVRNALKYDYPIVESIQSILPIVDEYVVSVGNSEDETLALIQSISSPKIKIVQSVWDDSLKTGGRVLAVETDKAFDHISEDTDWAFYLQGDEVVHEKDHAVIKSAAEKYLSDAAVEGLLFKYIHFYGTYDYIGDSRRWYNREIRMIRNDKTIRSYRDAQGFRKNDRKLNVKLINAYIYHYGWVKSPQAQKAKRDNFGNYWANNDQKTNAEAEAELFDYIKDVDSLEKFTGIHPSPMKNRVSNRNWDINFETGRKNMSFSDRILYAFEKGTGIRLFDYKNYRII